MTNILEVLPCETLINICSFLAKIDIKAARLTCKAFNDCSIEFLIDRAVVAARYGTLHALGLIIAHPVFARTVTCLTIDTSSFEPELTSKDAYLKGLRKTLAFYPLQECRAVLQQLHDDSVRRTNSKPKSEPFASRTIVGRAFTRYRKLYADQQQIRSQGLDRILILKTLQECPNIKALDFDSQCGPFSEDISPILTTWCLKPKKWRGPEPIKWTDPDPETTNVPFDLFWTKMLNSWPLSSKLERVSINFDAVWPDAWTFDKNTQLSTVFSNVKYLDLSFQAYNRPLESYYPENLETDIDSRTTTTHMASDFIAMRARNALVSGGARNMAKLICMASNLEHLRVDCGVNGDKPWQTQHILGVLVTPFSHISSPLSKLKTLEISGICSTFKNLTNTLSLGRGTLEKLSLNSVGLINGDWVDLVRFMAELGLADVDAKGCWGEGISALDTWTEYLKLRSAMVVGWPVGFFK